MTKSKTSADAGSNMALAVRLGKDVHAIPIEVVEEVLPALPIESIPQCPRFIRGVVFVRGHLIPVLDAAERLGLTDHERPLEPHIVCLRIDQRLIGVEFDEALDLMELGDGVPLAAHDVGAHEGFFAGVIERDGQVIRLLDPQKLLQQDEVIELERVPRAAE